MYLIILSIVIILIQGFLGLADWWVLGCNWILSALAMLGLVLAFDHERLAGFNNGSLFLKGWIVLTSFMNINHIYIQQDMEWWKQSLIILGYVSMISVGIGCWQSVNKATRSLLFGMIIALMSIIYAPMLVNILIVILLFIYLSSYSNRNIVGLFSGVIFTCWIVYALATIFGGSEGESQLIQNFVDQWSHLRYGLPAFTKPDTYTGIVLICMAAFCFFIYSLGGFIAENLNSLRVRSNISFLSTLLLLYILILPAGWSLYLNIGAVTLCAQLIFALNDHPTRSAVIAARIMLISYLVVGIAEPLIRLGWDFYMAE